MADILNAGIIILVAAFGLVAIVGAADEFRAIAGPASSHTESDAAFAAEDEASRASDVGTPIPAKHGLGDDRGDKRGDDDGERDRDDDRRGDDADDEDEEDDD